MPNRERGPADLPHGLRVLHLEDDPADAELIHAALQAEAAGVEIRRVDTREAFLDALASGSFDIVLSDYALPTFDGISAAREMRSRNIDLPLIMISGTLGEDRAVEALKAGATDFLGKQHLSRLVPAVARALEEARERAGRRRAEERIREQAALLEAAREAILVQDLGGRLSYWNRGAERLYGLTAEQVEGRTFSEVLYEGASQDLAQGRRTVVQAGDWSGQLNQRTLDGRDIVVQSHWTLVRDPEGRPRGVLVINSDITEARRLEAKFLRAQRMESLGVLAGGVAHDLNNILAPILMAVDVLRRKELDAQTRRLMTAVEASARRGADLVKQVLTFARGGEGLRAPLQLRHVISEMERMARETFPKSIEVRTEVPSDLWTIMGQSTPLQQVLMNLCVNSRDAMPKGGVLTIAAENVTLDEGASRIHPLARPGPYTRLTVSDTGEGIAPEVLDRIFDPFFTTKPLGRGTGLGLSTTLSIVNGHGGFIDVQSELGRGTTFHVYIPALPPSVSAPEAVAEAQPEPGSGELVLLVDDEASILQMAREVLEGYGFGVITAGGGRDAIAQFRQRQADVRVVVTDLSMPDMDGVSLIRALREIDSRVAIVASSGVIEGAPVDTGADSLLAKPYTARQLVDTVRSLSRPR
jgi:two-component system cell cycle sensor histidine kinase/response regulator CckA